MSYLGTSDLGTCEACGQVIRLLPHHCPHRWVPEHDWYGKTCVDCDTYEPDADEDEE